MANVSSYNSGGCGGCGSGGNAYPALSRLFVNSIEPCSFDGTISMNQGQVIIEGTTDTTSVTGTLSVNGPITSTGALTTTGNFTTQNTTINGSLNVDSSTLVVDPSTNRVGINTATPTEALDVTGNAKVSGNLNVDTNTLVVLASSNRVGVNTTTPTEALDVNGNTRVVGDLEVTGWVNSNVGVSAAQITGNQIDIGYFDQVRFRSDDEQMGFDVTDEDGFTVTHLGEEGITTTAITANSMIVNGSLTVDSTTLKVNPSTNRVGINTATPTVALDVTGDIKASGGVNCLTLDTEQLVSSVSSNLASTVVSSLDCTGNLVVNTNVIKTDITNNRVGINTTTPTEALDVTGNIRSSGNLTVSSSVSSGGLITGGVIRSSTTSSNGMFRVANYVAGATGLSITTAAAVFPWAGTLESNYNFPITQSSGVFTNNTGGTLFILAFYNVYFTASNAGTWRKAWISKQNSTTLYGWNQQSAGANCTQAGTTCSGFAYIKVLNTETFQLNVQSDAALTMGSGNDCMMTVFAL